MALIYKITNLLNGKIYIGQTRTSLSQRMNKHYSQGKKEGQTGIDGAIFKYGKENFSVEILEYCLIEELDERERFYINYYNSYNNGYNLTKGGQDGAGAAKDFSIEDVYKKLEQFGSIRGAAKALNCCERTLSNFMKNHNIISPYKNQGRVENILGKGKPFQQGDQTKKVYCLELNKTFSSLKECSEFLINHKYAKTQNVDAVRKSLSRHLTGNRKTYLKMHFKYA